MTSCPEPALCQAGDQCAGRCREHTTWPGAVFHDWNGGVYDEHAAPIVLPRLTYFREQMDS